MSIFKSIAKMLPDVQEQKSLNGLTVQSQARIVGFNGVTLYPHNTGTKYISEGFNKNAAVYAIVSKCAKKLAQIPVYHYRVKRDERKTLQEYFMLTKNGLSPEVVLEAKRMRKKAIDSNIVDSELSKLLANPNRLQSGAMWREQLYGYKLLTGEGDALVNRETDLNGQPKRGGKPLELLIIPKLHLSINTAGTPFDIQSFNIDLNGRAIPNIPKENIIMWVFPNYNFNAVTLDHLRGFAPLEAGLRVLQADNEGEERSIIMNKNQGAAGLLYLEDSGKDVTGPQSVAVRQEVNAAVNDRDLAGSVSVLMGGKWGYHQFGLDAEALRLLEKADVNMQRLCNIFDVPPGLFAKDQTYENLKEAKRNWIYDNIAVAAYSLRDLLNEKLLPDFNLDRERDFIDFDVTALPELAIDLQKTIGAVMQADFLTQDEKRIAVGYEPLATPAMKAVYMAAGKQPVEHAFEPIEDDLTDDANQLEE